MRRSRVFGGCLLALTLAAAPARAISLGAGLSVVARSGRELAVAASEEQVLLSAPVIAGSARKPTIDVYARETVLAEQPRTIVNSQSFPIADSESFSFGVKVRQLLYDFGKTDAAVRAATLDTQAKHADTALVRNRSALRFIIGYLRLRRAEQLLSLQQVEVTRFEAHRDDTRSLLEEGTITENNLLEAEVRLADAVQRRLQAENARALAAAQVNSLLAQPLGQPVTTEEIPEPAAGGAQRGLEEAFAAAAKERSEFKVVQGRIAAAQARRAAVNTEFYPQLYLAGGYDFTQNEFTVHEGNWAVQAGVDLNLFAGGVTEEKLRQKDRELQLLERSREQLLDAVQLEVQEAFLSLQTSRARVGATEKAVEQAQENLRLQRLRYTEGVGTGTDVLDAVSLATTAEQNFLNARHDVSEARARLGYAVGNDLVAAWGGDATQHSQGGRP